MKHRAVKVVVGFFCAGLLAVAPVKLRAADHQHEHKDQHAEVSNAASGPNPLIEEMIILDNTFREVVSGVSLGDGARVHKALEAMHGTMEKTHEGVHAGHVQIPKNAHRVKELVKQDKVFHHNLELLAEAAHANDQKKMLSLTKKLLDGCVKCHATFRK